MLKRPFGYQFKRLLTVTICSIGLLLTGCATNTNMLETLSEKTVLTPDQGIVVVRIINATDYSLPLNQVTIE